MRSLSFLCTGVASLAQFSGIVGAQDIAAPDSARLASAPDLTGTWDATVRSYGGIGSTIILSRDSAFTLVLGAMVDVKYTVVGDKFTFFSDQPGDSRSETQKLLFESGQAVLSGHGCSRKLTRFDPQPGDSGLVGKWKSMHMTGVPAYEEYTRDGLARLRVPIQVQRGTFAVTGNTINFHTRFPRPEEWSAQFNVSGDTLTFSIGGEQKPYLRARSLIPLDVQQPVKPDHMVC